MEHKIIIKGRPITKKNSQQILFKNKGGKKIPFIIPSRAYNIYSEACGWQIKSQYKEEPINELVNIKCVYYMPTKHKVDLLNLMSATMDILVDYNVIEDDNSKIVYSHDRSRVFYDKDRPRVEITITSVSEDGEKD